LGLRNSGVTSGNYGGSTQIPVLAVDAFGRITSASNVAVSTTINLAANNGSGSVSGGGTLTVIGNTGISTTTTGSTIYIDNTGVTSLSTGSTSRVTVSSATGASTIDLAAVPSILGGSYSYPAMTVDSYGRVTLISNQSPVVSFSGGSTGLTPSSATNGAITLGGTLGIGNGGTNNTTYTPGQIIYYDGSKLNSLANTGVVAGTYGNTTTIPSITVDAYGRITAVSNNSTSSGSTISIVTNVDRFTGTGSTTIFTLANAPFNANNTLININGVTQQKSTYTVSGTTLTFSTAPFNGDSIEVSYSYNLPPSQLTGVVTNVDSFTGNGALSSFVLSNTPISANNLTININGATQQKSTYTLTGNTIFLSEAPRSGSTIEASYFFNTTVAFTSLTPTLSSVSLAYSSQGNSIAYANTARTSNLIDLFSTLAFRSAIYDVQVTNGSGYQMSKLIVVQSDSDASVMEFGTVSTYPPSLGTFTANVAFNSSLNTNVAQLFFNPNYAGNTTVVINRTTIANTGSSSLIQLGQSYDLNSLSIGSIDLNTLVNEPIDLNF
jgi:hypothetical protein